MQRVLLDTWLESLSPAEEQKDDDGIVNKVDGYVRVCRPTVARECDAISLLIPVAPINTVVIMTSTGAGSAGRDAVPSMPWLRITFLVIYQAAIDTQSAY